MVDEPSFQQLQRFFPQIQFSPEEARHFRSLWKTRTFDRSEFITEAGQTERYFYFVLEGVQAIYLLNQKGQKVVLGFSYSGSPSGVFDSFLLQRPAATFLMALKPSKMLAISLPQYQSLFASFPAFHAWGHAFMQNILFGRLDREIELLTLSAEQRYKAFVRRCPAELKTIPQKFLASYLNMTPETFSRLRSTVRYKN